VAVKKLHKKNILKNLVRFFKEMTRLLQIFGLIDIIQVRAMGVAFLRNSVRLLANYFEMKIAFIGSVMQGQNDRNLLLTDFRYRYL
jgi:hypothetical protein